LLYELDTVTAIMRNLVLYILVMGNELEGD